MISKPHITEEYTEKQRPRLNLRLNLRLKPRLNPRLDTIIMTHTIPVSMADPTTLVMVINTLDTIAVITTTVDTDT